MKKTLLGSIALGLALNFMPLGSSAQAQNVAVENYRGEWSTPGGITRYPLGSVVTYQGRTYIRIADGGGNPRVATNAWDVLSTTAIGPIGPTVETGAPGAPGAPGADGATGATGANGTNGTNGAVGPTGANGTNGTNGATGATGVTGATGAGGTAGLKGNNGATGARGPTGPSGPSGTVGATGASGPSGPKGLGKLTIRSETAPVPVGTNADPYTHIEVDCSANELATGGSIVCSRLNQTIAKNNVVAYDYPLETASQPTGWQAEVENTGSNSAECVLTVICVQVDPGGI